jgi:deoxycytidylate deaminase
VNRIDRIMRDLCLMAQDTPAVGQARLAAAIVYRRQVVAYGVNQRKSHPLQKRFGKNSDSIYPHAEVNAVRNSVNRMGGVDFLRESVLIVARMRVIDGKWRRGLAKPCSGCERCIEAFGIRDVVWTEDE